MICSLLLFLKVRCIITTVTVWGVYGGTRNVALLLDL